MAKTDPPQTGELELSLFGPGIGECIVVHLGAGNWMVVDSCLGPEGNGPIAIEYLRHLGVNISQDVKLVVASHWHDDHIRGIAQVVRYASSARFACSAALRCEEFLTLVEAYAEAKLVEHTSGLSEFAEVLQILQDRGAQRNLAGPHHWAADGSRLYQNSDPFNVEVYALSPSSGTITDGRIAIARLLPQVDEAIRRFPRVSPNDSSVALLVKADVDGFLLGADLERGREGRGWRAVVDSQVRPGGQSSTYKVAHHGSSNADLSDTWTTLLVATPYALLTPYAGGRQPLPSEGDVHRIKMRTGHVYCTAWPPTKSPGRRNGSVERTMKEVVCSRRSTRKVPGHVRIRMPLEGDATDARVEVYEGARRL
jgi:hypothetical protein